MRSLHGALGLRMADAAGHFPPWQTVYWWFRRFDPGFAILPKRWVVEQTFGRLTRFRPLVRDYEARIDVSETGVLPRSTLWPLVFRPNCTYPGGIIGPEPLVMTAAKTLANRLATVQPELALSIARAIDAPWFRCQALSQVARYWPNEQYPAILSEATLAADAQDQTYNQVAVLAWPIRAYLERGDAPSVKALLVRGVNAAKTIENMGSRSEALFDIFQAAKPFDTDLWLPVFWALVEASEPRLAWRQLRNLKSAVSMVLASDPDVAQDTLERLEDAKNLSTIRRHLDGGIVAEPRPYFWIEDAAPS